MPDIYMHVKLGLTAGEWERILRYRTASSQTKRARDLKVSRGVYQKWEQDQSKLSKKTITALEWCRLQRLRAKQSQEQLAEHLGITRIWLNKMENGSVSPHELLVYWEFDNKKMLGELEVVKRNDDRGRTNG